MNRTNAPSMLRRIRTAVRTIPEPRVYFDGRSPEHAWKLPTSILFFVRHRADILTSSHSEKDSSQQHHRFVLITALSGSGSICVDDEKIPLNEGESLLLFPFQFHSYHAVQPDRICWLFCTFEMPAAGLLESLRNSPRKLRAAEMAALKVLADTWRNHDPAPLLQLQLAGLLIQLAAASGSRRRRAQDTGNAEFLAQINRHLIPRLDRPLGVKDLADAQGCSESFLRKTFREKTGTSLGAHIRALRIHRACSLLLQSLLPIGEIATRCGYDSLYSFSRSFRQSIGTAPREYRRKWRAASTGSR